MSRHSRLLEEEGQYHEEKRNRERDIREKKSKREMMTPSKSSNAF
jgi:hypothetical protein